MNARHALTATALAAVLVPVALTAAPAASASGGGSGDSSPVPTATTSAAPSASPTATPLATSPATPTATGTATHESSPDASPTSAPSVSSSATRSPAPTGTLTTVSSSPGSDVTATPGTTLPGTPTASPGETADVDRPNGLCEVAGFDVRVEGLPSRIAAGTTSDPFTVVLDNTAGHDATRVQFGLAVGFRDGSRDADWLAAERYVTARYYDWGGERWRTASDGGGVYTYADIEAGRRYEMRLRLVLAPDTPPGAAGALAFSTRWSFDRVRGDSDCVYDNEWYRFEITAPGSTPAAAEVRPQGGSAPEALREAARPDRGGAARVDGALAHTGPGSGLRVTALASVLVGLLGVAAVLFGARARQRG